MPDQIDKYKQFLTSSWNPYSLWHKSKYDAFGSTPSRDLLQDLDLGNEVDLLLVGVGEYIMHCYSAMIVAEVAAVAAVAAVCLVSTRKISLTSC